MRIKWYSRRTARIVGGVDRKKNKNMETGEEVLKGKGRVLNEVSLIVLRGYTRIGRETK